jgi:hypothetical protein
VIHRPFKSILPPVQFTEAELCGRIDSRRWRAGERNTRLARSPIAGYGSFAVAPIFRGGPILVREPLSGNFPVNHSDWPNAARASNRAGLFALRDIQPGEEITEDYRFLPFFGQAIPLLPRQIAPATQEEYDALVRAVERP